MLEHRALETLAEIHESVCEFLHEKQTAWTYVKDNTDHLKMSLMAEAVLMYEHVWQPLELDQSDSVIRSANAQRRCWSSPSTVKEGKGRGIFLWSRPSKRRNWELAH